MSHQLGEQTRVGSLEEWTHCELHANGLRFHAVTEGSGPLVVLLHGFPEFCYSWRHQIPALASAGFRVLAPDLRGYNLSDKPPGVRSYRVSLLIQDVVGLIEQLGAERAIVVGHDWGGGVAWNLALTHPQVVERLVILNAPHPAAFRRELRNPLQWLRSWYVFFFQLPWLPEWLLRAGNYALIEHGFRLTVRPGAFSDEDIQRYKEALDRPGALTATVNWYRAALRYPETAFRTTNPILIPTLLIWGEQDRYLVTRLSEGLEPWVRNLRVERLPNASHWVQNDAPDVVNRLLVEFLTARAEG